MKKEHVIYMNLVLIIALFISHTYVLMQTANYISWLDVRTSTFAYPQIVIHWSYPPSMMGGEGGTNIFDIALIFLIVAVVANLVVLSRKDKTEIRGSVKKT